MWLVLTTTVVGWLVVGWSTIYRLAIRDALRFRDRFPTQPAPPLTVDPFDWLFVPVWPCAILGDWLFWRDKIGPGGRVLPYPEHTRR